MYDDIPEQFEAYERGLVIARGGSGAVYEGIRADTGEKVAIKVVFPSQVGRDAYEMIDREAYLLQRLGRKTQGVPKYLLHGYAGRFPCLAMERVQGITLRQLLDTRALGVGEVLEILLPLLFVLEIAHNEWIVHLDLKPDNIMLCHPSNGASIKLLDFGIAKCADEGERHTPCVGTAGYSAREQLLGEQEITTACDIFSLGVVFYEMLTGYPLFPEKEYTFAHRYAMSEIPIEPSPPPTCEANGFLWAILKTCLATHPGQRPSASDLTTLLRHELMRIPSLNDEQRIIP